ncbi:MAG: glycosyltransferase [Chloroflexota bacterium]
MKATVIIPAHNGESYLRPCLEALLAQEGAAFDVIVVDNGSSDGGADLVARLFPQVRLVRSVAPLGFAGACNLGIRAALEGGPGEEPPEAVVLLNQDTVVDPGWLAALLQPLREDPAAGVVGSLARYPDGRIQHAGAELLEPLG